MKKIIISLVVAALAAFSANAQWWAGGSIGYSYSGGVNSVTFAPEVGYNINDSWTVAGALNFNTRGNDFSFTFTPYARFSFWQSGIVSLFVDGGLCGGVNHDGIGNTSYAVFGLGARPGIALALNEKLCFVTHLGFLGWEMVGNNNSFGIGIDGNVVGVGLYYCF